MKTFFSVIVLVAVTAIVTTWVVGCTTNHYYVVGDRQQVQMAPDTSVSAPPTQTVDPIPAGQPIICNRPHQEPQALVPAVVAKPEPVQAPVLVAEPKAPAPVAAPADLAKLPTVGAAAQDYIKSIPDGVYAPIWNVMGIGDPQAPTIARVVVAISNKGRFLAADGPKPKDGLEWKVVKVVVYAHNPDRTVRTNPDGSKVTILAPLWVAAVDR
jgi:hypothetical protein